MRPRILFLVPDDYDALERKGVAHMILERDEHGFFERVLTVHPIAMRERAFDLDAIHRVIEFDLGRALRGGSWLALASAPLRLLRLVWTLAGLIRRERVDLIRANDPYLMGLLAWAASRVTRTPFCVAIHANYDMNFALTPKRGVSGCLRVLAAWCPAFVLPRAALVLPIRNNLARWAERCGARPERTHVIPHGLRATEFRTSLNADAVRERFGIRSRVAIVSFVGRFSRVNHVYDVVAVAERILAVRSDVVFLFLGDGEERTEIERRISASPRLAAGVRLAGFRPADEVIAVRGASAVSIVLTGGFSLLEACAAGSAVVAYDIDWHRDVVRHDDTGLLVPEHDLEALTDAVQVLLNDPAHAKRLGEQARAFTLAHHDEQQTSAVKRDCYMLLLGAGAAR